MDNNLDPEIRIGYHAHNNFQLAFSNSIKFLALETKREIVVDSTVYGMGKSAGNTASELIALHMNQRYGKNYDIDQFLEILDTDLMSVYQQHYWGYKYSFYISAMQNCHPNYVHFLLDRKTLSVTSINEILSKIPKDIKLDYKQKYIENAYIEYQSHAIDDQRAISELSDLMKDKTILLLGPGKSLGDDEKKIKGYIESQKPIVISVNFEPSTYDCDYVFVSNAKRYSKLTDITDKFSGAKLITTSNISLFDKQADYVLNYSSLINRNRVGSDNALLLAIAFLEYIGIENVTLAGFDGFRTGLNDYYDSKYAFAGNDEYNISSNETTTQGMRNLSGDIKILFLTKSIYEGAIQNE